MKRVKILGDNNFSLIVIRSCYVIFIVVYLIIDYRDERKVFRKR